MLGHIPLSIPLLASDSLRSLIFYFSCVFPAAFPLCPFPPQNYTTNEKATVDQHFKELIRDLERQRDEVKAALDQREKIASENVKEIVDELEERAKLLREDKENREQIHQISDSVLFLQVTEILYSFHFFPRGQDKSQVGVRCVNLLQCNAKGTNGRNQSLHLKLSLV